jgi:hypothetical protein
MKKHNFNVVFHPEIQFDLREAMDYYNSKRENLGDRFYSNARHDELHKARLNERMTVVEQNK